MRKVLLVAAASALAALWAPVAHANGRFPESNQLLFSPGDTSLVVLRTTFGVLISRDAAATWRWLCEDALDLPPTSSADPSLGLTGSDALVAGIYKGLEVSPDLGCTWGFAGGPVKGQFIPDLAVRPNAPHTVVTIASTYGEDAGADGGAGYANQAYESTDDGANWSTLGVPIDPTVLVTTIDVAASDPQRLYVSGFRLATSAGAPNRASLFVSLDAGAHWIERPLPALVNEVAAYIAAVDPSDADLVYLRTSGPMVTPSQSRLMVTSDAGQSFSTPLAFTQTGEGGAATGQMLGFALSTDGSKVYAGGTQDGLYVGARAGLADAASPFHKTSSIHVQCLATHGAELWACSDEVSGFVAGVSTDDGATFTAKLHLTGIQAPLACAPDATAAQCSGAFPQLCETLGGCAGPDGGSSAADGGARPPPTNPTRPSGGCSVVGGGAMAGAVDGRDARRARSATATASLTRRKRDGRDDAKTQPAGAVCY